ncbi:MAG: hypothetical protein R2940_13220 [Syntrophotaleaceae bacterium]
MTPPPTRFTDYSNLSDLHIPSSLVLHNYMLYRPDASGHITAYVGESSGRISRVVEDRSRIKRRAMNGEVMLFFCPKPLHDPGMRKLLEARLYYALRRSPGWHFLNSNKGLGATARFQQGLTYVEHCMETVWLYLRKTGYLGTSAQPFGWVPSPGQFELAFNHEGSLYFADATVNSFGNWEVAAGSFAKASRSVPHDDHFLLRQNLIANKVLNAVGNGLYKFVQSFEFAHPATAAGVISGQNAPGDSWRQRKTGLPISGCSLPGHLVGRWPRC